MAHKHKRETSRFVGYAPNGRLMECQECGETFTVNHRSALEWSLPDAIEYGMTPEKARRWLHEGRITQDLFDAYADEWQRCQGRMMP